MKILGISAFDRDSAATLVCDGEIVAAAEEERFSRRRHDAGFPSQAIRYCLAEAGIAAGDLDFVGFHEKPFRKFERLLESALAMAPRGYRGFRRMLPEWLTKTLHIPREIDRVLGRSRGARDVFVERPEAHAASAFYPSPFEDAAVVTISGAGEWCTTAIGRGTGNRVELLRELRYPHSLGLLCSAFSHYLGLGEHGEDRLMHLAAAGEPACVDRIRSHLIDVKDDGSFRMDMAYFDYVVGGAMTSARFHRLFGGPPRRPEERVAQRHRDLAASVQRVVEDIVLRTVEFAHEETGSTRLCLAGRIAQNSLANGRVVRESPFQHVWIQPAAGGAGAALGVALFVWYELLGRPRTPREPDDQRGSLLGPAYSTAEIGAALESAGAHCRVLQDSDLIDEVASSIERGEVVGWFQGRMEFGPHGLGSRSLLGDARDDSMPAKLNARVAYRDPVVPVPYAVLRDRAADEFDLPPGAGSPYMLLSAGRSSGGAAQVQTVDDRQPLLRRLMQQVERRTGSPSIINSSLNLDWEPLVNRPEEAYRTFMSSGIDVLVLGNAVLRKADQESERESRGDGAEDPALESLWRCPGCGGELVRGDGAAACAACGHEFPRTEGIWQLFWPHEGDTSGAAITDAVKGFYEEHPFPNYDRDETVRTLAEKARRGVYARLLGEQIPFNARVIEIGCGTGQLTNYLALGCRTMVGADLCLNSLRLAEKFRSEQGLSRVRFIQMNLFRPCLPPESFDVVLCNGVLLTTRNPAEGFQSIARLVKPGGLIVIGLYNTYGRLMMDLRRAFFRITRGRFRWVDPYIRKTPMSAEKEDAWFADQYLHPHETKQTMGEVLGWFEQAGIEFLNGVPKLRPYDEFREDEPLFAKSPTGTALERAISQARMIATGNQEGGFFIMIGRKRE